MNSPWPSELEYEQFVLQYMFDLTVIIYQFCHCPLTMGVCDMKHYKCIKSNQMPGEENNKPLNIDFATYCGIVALNPSVISIY